MADAKKHVAQVSKALENARKAMFEIKVAVGKGDTAKDVDTILTDAMKLASRLSQLEKDLPEDASKHVAAASQAFEVARKGMFEIKVAVGKGGAVKDIDKLLVDAQKVEGNFRNLAKTIG
ncbi:MAG: hypothetical protein ACK4GO_15320 [Gemmobacter sp.]